MAGDDLDRDLRDALDRFLDLRAEIRDLHERVRCNPTGREAWGSLFFAAVELGDELRHAVRVNPRVQGVPVDIDF